MTQEDKLHCYGFEIDPGEGAKIEDLPDKIRSHELSLKGAELSYWNTLVDKADSGMPVTFLPTESGKQENETQALVRGLAYPGEQNRYDQAKKLAAALCEQTPASAGDGLMLVFVRVQQNTARVVLWRYPRTTALRVEKDAEGDETLVRDPVWVRRHERFKAALFEDGPGKNTFRTGYSEDKQTADKDGAARYWMERFLQASPTQTDARGTRDLAVAIKQAEQEADDPAERTNLINASKTLLSAEGTSTNMKTFIETTLTPAAQERVLKKISTTADLETPFTIKPAEAARKIGKRRVGLHNGVEFVGDTRNFDEIVALDYEASDLAEGEVEIRVRGRITHDKVTG